MADTKFTQPVMGRRTFIGGTLAAGAVAALAGCGGESKDGGKPASGDKVMNFYLSEPAFIDPYNAQENQGTAVVFATFDGLMEWDWDTASPVPACAAEAPTVSEDGRVYTFKLREGMKFHNGDPVDAESFIRGWKRVASPKMEAPSDICYHLAPVAGYKEFNAGDTEEFAGLKAVDELTLEVTLTDPMADFPAVCCHPGLAPVPQCALDDPKAFLERPIGNGPFMLTEPWKHNQYINLAKFEDYYGDAPKLDGVYMSIQKDPDTAFNEFEAGSMDFAAIPTGKIKKTVEKYGKSEDGFTSTPGKQVMLGTELSTYFLIPSPTDPYLGKDNPKASMVRRALSLAIDRQNIVDTLFEGSRMPATSIMPTSIDDSPENVWEDCKYDPEAAAKLLDEAGYPANGDGKRDIQITLNYNGDGDHGDLMSAVQLNLEKVGITVEQSTVEWATYLTQLSEKNFCLGRLGWTADYPTMDNFLYPNFYTGADNNYEEYSNPEADKLMLEARQIKDEEQRKAACRKICNLIGKDMPVIPIMFYAHNYVGSERMKSFKYDAQAKPHFQTAELA
ncbi:MAG: ABC transporter substrate-binding protein [Coriobacteriaceae bacterium]|nr:ABC transporter substrate-binding protein [Coriobacteriaceae bacterium]